MFGGANSNTNSTTPMFGGANSNPNSTAPVFGGANSNPNSATTATPVVFGGAKPGAKVIGGSIPGNNNLLGGPTGTPHATSVVAPSSLLRPGAPPFDPSAADSSESPSVLTKHQELLQQKKDLLARKMQKQAKKKNDPLKATPTPGQDKIASRRLLFGGGIGVGDDGGKANATTSSSSSIFPTSEFRDAQNPATPFKARKRQVSLSAKSSSPAPPSISAISAISAVAAPNSLAATNTSDLTSASSLVGTCLSMCPAEEVVQREKEADIKVRKIYMLG